VGAQVALAKLAWPRLHHHVLPRTRLHGLLDGAAHRPVLWLCAQPGAGKTTLAAAWVRASRRPGLWYDLDAGDADAAAFVAHLRCLVPDGGNALPLLTPEYQQDLRGFSRRFFRAFGARLAPGTVLVLDNLHEVPEDAALHRLLAEGLAALPEGVTVLVASRAEPPAAYGALVAADAIAMVDGDELRLSPDETAAIARQRGVRDGADAARLHERCHGWAAGLTLLLARARRHGADADDDDAESLQHVFGWFAQRVFDDAPAEHRQALMALSFLPLATAETAQALTGLPDAGRLLEHCHRRHLFTDRRRVAGEAVFQFHALFRSFLRHRARESLGAQACREIAGRAARLLDAAGEWEAALALFEEAGDWDGHARTLLQRAESLLEQGRQQSVLDWLGRLPAPARAAHPWLAYWEGRALMAGASPRSLSVLQAAHHAFEVAGDFAGQVASAAAVVQALWFARLGWSEIGPWIERIEPMLDARCDAFPTPGVELLSWSALHAALAFCRPSHASIRSLGMRLMDGVEDAQVGWGQRLTTATHLITWLHNAAEYDLAARLIGVVDPRVETLPASAQQRAYWHVFRAMHDVRQGAYEEASARFDRAEAMARDEGLAQPEFAALQFRAYLDVLARRPEAARSRIARMERHPCRGQPDSEMNFRTVQTLLAQHEGDVRAAAQFARQALEATRRVGAAYFQAVFPPVLASAFADGGEHGVALEILAESRRLAEGSYLQAMEAQLLVEEAYVALLQGDEAACDARLAQGLSLAASERSKAAYVHRIVARKPVLLERALRAGVEVDFVRRTIRRWRIVPPDHDVPHWPWKVRVRTLGPFEVLVDDAPVSFGRKAPKKTLALMKAVIARGGSAPESALIDAFWPDEEGDAAQRSLNAAVHRLRALLGVAEAVGQQGGVVSLDRDLVWVDAWAFERGVSAGVSEEALSLYRGAFLSEDEGEAWPVAMRERLRARFIHAVSEHGAKLEAALLDDEAIACYLRGLEADAIVEPFYQGLMRCYARLDRLPEAVGAYRRLKQTLSVMLSLSPSAGTERLYRSLRLDAA
jgi:DNA-binding SARP family transcriptional activator